MAIDDPLVIIFAVFVLGGSAAYFLFQTRPISRAMVRVLFLIILTVAFTHAGIVPYKSLQSTGAPFLDAVHGALKVAWWFWAAWFLVGASRAFIIVERQPREGKLLQDLLAGVIYLGAVFAIISYVFDLPIQGLLATSGAVAIILGLALQSTLSDAFSGIILSFSRPYSPGDWISIEGGTDGRVIEINWRATRVLTAQQDVAIVPNSTIAKSKIVNITSPVGTHGATITVGLDARAPLSFAKQVLEHAILNCRLIVTSPSPSGYRKVNHRDCHRIQFDIFYGRSGSVGQSSRPIVRDDF